MSSSKSESKDTKGAPLSTTSSVVDTIAGATQEFAPLKNVCAYLSGFHVYADDTSRHVATTHYCGHLNDEVRQCLLYDSPNKDARLIGIEYMISERLYKDLDPEERKLWHSHVFEVKSGMLILPRPAGIPEAVWENAENMEMEKLIKIYGKIYHLWQVDRGDKLPLGPPKLMSSFIAEDQLDFDKFVGDRDRKLREDYKRKRDVRKYIPEPVIHPDADACWKKRHEE